MQPYPSLEDLFHPVAGVVVGPEPGKVFHTIPADGLLVAHQHAIAPGTAAGQEYPGHIKEQSCEVAPNGWWIC